mmetsp:Transcript_4690/g.17630  ORF Transcript_4690/g.17630 Transcript_4690/m.17630 type:complete len:214 (-) Transcript_4690:39-680(-)
MPRLTIQLIEQSPQFVNAHQKRELDLRGNSIAIVENMGATRDSFDCIDLSNNSIQALSNFPKLVHLQSLYLCHNQMHTIQQNLHEFLPNLNTLNLTNNKIASLDEVSHLKQCSKLENLVLKENPVCSVAQYRQQVIRLLPQLKYLDHLKVKKQEREQVQQMESETFEPGKVMPQEQMGLTQEQKDEILNKLKEATSLAEINRLEACLRENRMP